MDTLRRITRVICAVLAFSVASLSLPTTAAAAMVGTDGVIAKEQGARDRGRITAALNRDDVQQQLAALGVDPHQAQARVAAMTDDEIKALHGRLNAMPAGGTDILGVALVAFIVLLVTDILGYTHVFPFVKHPR